MPTLDTHTAGVRLWQLFARWKTEDISGALICSPCCTDRLAAQAWLTLRGYQGLTGDLPADERAAVGLGFSRNLGLSCTSLEGRLLLSALMTIPFKTWLECYPDDYLALLLEHTLEPNRATDFDQGLWERRREEWRSNLLRSWIKDGPLPPKLHRYFPQSH